MMCILQYGTAGLLTLLNFPRLAFLGCHATRKKEITFNLCVDIDAASMTSHFWVMCHHRLVV